MGFPFSNFYLPSCATATVCWPVNLPIIAHSVVGGKGVCICVCIKKGKNSSMALYISCSNTCRDLTKEFFYLPVDTKDKKTNTSVCNCMGRLCICVYPVKHVRRFLIHSVLSFSICVHV